MLHQRRESSDSVPAPASPGARRPWPSGASQVQVRDKRSTPVSRRRPFCAPGRQSSNAASGTALRGARAVCPTPSWGRFRFAGGSEGRAQCTACNDLRHALRGALTLSSRSSWLLNLLPSAKRHAPWRAPGELCCALLVRAVDCVDCHRRRPRRALSDGALAGFVRAAQWRTARCPVRLAPTTLIGAHLCAFLSRQCCAPLHIRTRTHTRALGEHTETRARHTRWLAPLISSARRGAAAAAADSKSSRTRDAPTPAPQLEQLLAFVPSLSRR